MRLINQKAWGTLFVLAFAAGEVALGQNLLLKDRQQVIMLGDSLTEGEDPDGSVFVDFYPPVADQDGKLRRDFTDDGLHCNAAGYAVLKPLVEKALTELR